MACIGFGQVQVEFAFPERIRQSRAEDTSSAGGYAAFGRHWREVRRSASSSGHTAGKGRVREHDGLTLEGENVVTYPVENHVRPLTALAVVGRNLWSLVIET